MRTEYEKRTNFSESQKISWGHLKTFGVEKKKAGKELDCDVTQEDFGRGIFFCYFGVFGRAKVEPAAMWNHDCKGKMGSTGTPQPQSVKLPTV